MQIQTRHTLLLLALALAACAGTGVAEPSATPPAPSATPAPTLTPLPVPQLVLVAEGEPPSAARLREWAAPRGWETVLVQPAELGTALGDPSVEARAVVSFGVPIGQPVQAPLVLVEVPGAAPQPAVSSVGSPGGRYDQAGFLAGVMAGLATQVEWVGEVSGGEDPRTSEYLAGFAQGLKFGCPRCRLVSLGLSEATADGFRGRGADVVFVPPGPEALPIAAALGEAGLWVVWVGELPEGFPAAALAGRVAYLTEPLVVRALEALAGGAEGQAWPYAVENGGLVVADLNPQAISIGRQRLLEQAFQAVASGELELGIENR